MKKHTIFIISICMFCAIGFGLWLLAKIATGSEVRGGWFGYFFSVAYALGCIAVGIFGLKLVKSETA